MKGVEEPTNPTGKKWGRTAAEYLRLNAGPAPSRPAGTAPSSTLRALRSGRVTWRPDAVDLELIRPSGIERSLARLVRSMPVLIWNAAALEGNTFTLPQVQTLLDGVTVGGKKLEEAEQILALSEAMEAMITDVREGAFTLDKSTSDRVHGIVARHEAIEAGSFRGAGRVHGGGAVRLAGGGTVEGDPSGDDGELLQADYANLLASLDAVDDPRAKALAYFASAVRSQFYFDGNKRTARIMMTGALIQAGFEPVSIPFARQEEFNIALDELFRTDDGTRLISFLTTCVLPDAR